VVDPLGQAFEQRPKGRRLRFGETVGLRRDLVVRPLVDRNIGDGVYICRPRHVRSNQEREDCSDGKETSDSTHMVHCIH